MITFNGTVKEFLKNYPKEERKVGETYRIITTKGSNDYQFVGSVSEKNFKRIENSSTVVNEIDGAELDTYLRRCKKWLKDNFQEEYEMSQAEIRE